MTVTIHVEAPAGSRLADLLSMYEVAKPAAAAAVTQLKTITDMIKTEALTSTAPGAQRIEVAAGNTALQLSYVESWSLDTKRLKAEDPATYVRYARKSGSWRLGQDPGMTAADTRCEVTELYVGQCAHCRKLPDVAPLNSDEEGVYNPYGHEPEPGHLSAFPANYRSECGECGTDILPGQMIELGAGSGYVHQDCPI